MNPCFAKKEEKLDVKSNSFMDLGRYVETLEINDEEQFIAPEEKETNDNFEEIAIQDVTQRYKENEIELVLDDINETAIDEVNAPYVFQLKANHTQFVIEQNIKNENMIWDGSKSFSRNFLTGSRSLAPIPSIVNSQSIKTKVNPELSASLGQTWLFNSQDTSVLFVRANESTYNTGSVISYSGDGLNLSVGSFSSSYNHAASGGAILSTKELLLPQNTGSLSFGGAYFANEEQTTNKTTSGVFGAYKYKRLKLNAQVGKSKYSNAINYDTSLYFAPELQISDSLSLTTRFIRNISTDIKQDELVLTYKPIKNKNNLEIELNASNQYTNNASIKQRLKLSTTFRF